jgi:hypothetical protein
MPASPEVVHLTSNAGRTDLGVVLARGMRGVRLAVPSTTPKRRQTRIVSRSAQKNWPPGASSGPAVGTNPAAAMIPSWTANIQTPLTIPFSILGICMFTSK